MSAISFEIKLDRVNKIYQEGETIYGKLLFDCKTEIKHQGINLWLSGVVNLQKTSKNVGLLETFSNSIKPMNIIYEVVKFPASANLYRFPAGKSEIEFSIPLKPKPNKVCYESYHGVFIVVQYLLKCEIVRSILNKDLQRSVEIIVENRPETIGRNPPENKSITFTITPNSNGYDLDREVPKFPDFKIVGTLDNIRCRLHEPLTGKLLVMSSNMAIKSIELQLCRIETCGLDEQFTVDATEIQKLQIVDGNIVRNSPVPIYLLFPRLFTCSTLITTNFKIEFELNLIVSFDGNFVVKETFRLELVRH